MAQRTWFTTEQVEMLHTDVEGDGKQVRSRPATEQDKRNFAAQYTDFQNQGAQAQQANQQQPAQAGQQGAGQPPR